MMGPGAYDAIIRSVIQNKMYGKLKDEEADMEKWNNPQQYPIQPFYMPGGIEEMLRGMDQPRSMPPMADPEYLYNYPIKRPDWT